MDPTNPQTQPNSQPQQQEQSPIAPKNNTVLYAIIFITLAIVGTMLYFIISKNQVKTQSVQQGNVTTPQITPASNKSPEEKEVEAVDINDPAPSELNDIEKDINSL